MPRYTYVICDNNTIKFLHVQPDVTLRSREQVQEWLDIKYKDRTTGPMNLYGVHIPDYPLEKPYLISVLSGHVKVKNLPEEEVKLTYDEWKGGAR